MAVYVDPLFDAHRRNLEGYQWSHMFADTVAELHAMAKKIGRNRCWFEGVERGFPHYDLTPSFRQKAVEAGALSLTRREFVDKSREIRARAAAVSGRTLTEGGEERTLTEGEGKP